MKRIKDFFKNYDDEMAAYAFAEAGELEMAKQILAESEHGTKKESSLTARPCPVYKKVI